MVFIPRQAMRLWGILWFLIFLGKSWGQEQRYVISTAKDFHFTIPENVSTQAHGYTKAFKATVSRKSYPDGRIQPTQLSEGEDSVLEAVFEHFSNLNEIPTINTSVSLFNDADKFLHTDKFLYTPRHSDEAYKEMTNSSNVTTVLKEEIERIAAKYRHPVVKKCCYDGARRNDRETCDQRAAQITIGPRCVRAFSECCVKANQIRANDTHKCNLIRMEQEDQLTINIARVRRDLEKVQQTQTVEQQAAKYTNPRVKRCCHDGARPNNFESCQERAARVTLGPHCVRAFTDCCVIAKRNRDQTSFKPVSISSVRHQGEIQR